MLNEFIGRAIIYVRVSSEEQADNFSIESQIEACKRYAKEHDFTVIVVLQDVMSGAKLDRPGLSKLREFVRANTIDTVIVYSSDRLTRSVAHAMLLRDEMKTAGVGLHTVARGMSQDSPEGGLMETIEAAFAEYERLKIAERMQRGQRQRIISKLSHGNKLPFGYCYADDERVQIAINEEEAAVVRMIFNWYLTEPIGSFQIANRLTELRLPTPADRKSYFAVLKKRARGEWSQSSVTAIIKQPAYKGELQCVYGGETFVIRVPPIITSGEWERAAYLRAERLRLSRRHARQLYVLRTHVHCGRCGSSCTGSHGGRRFHYYRCNGIAKPRADMTKCNLPQFRDIILENKVWSWLCSDVLSEDRIRVAIASLDDDTEGERARVESERTIIAHQLEGLDLQASKLIDLYTAGGFTLDEVAAQKTHLDQARTSCRKALAELDERLAGMATMKQRADELCELVRSVRVGLPDLPNEERYRIINLLDVQITLDFEGEAGRGKHPVLYADAVCNLTLDSIRLWVLGDLAVGNKTTTLCAPG